MQWWYRRVTASLPAADILIVDDASPDGTGEVIREIAALDPSVTLIERSGKLGLGSAHKIAFEYAYVHDYDALLTLDADLSHEPEQLVELLNALQGCSFVIGTRWGDGSSDYTGTRRFISWMGNWMARHLLRASVSEYTTSMRAFDQTALECLVSNPPQDDGYAFFMEVVAQLHRSGLNLQEVPIRFHDRTHGKSKIPRGQIIVSSARLLSLAIARRRLGGSIR